MTGSVPENNGKELLRIPTRKQSIQCYELFPGKKTKIISHQITDSIWKYPDKYLSEFKDFLRTSQDRLWLSKGTWDTASHCYLTGSISEVIQRLAELRANLEEHWRPLQGLHTWCTTHHTWAQGHHLCVRNQVVWGQCEVYLHWLNSKSFFIVFNFNSIVVKIQCSFP